MLAVVCNNLSLPDPIKQTITFTEKEFGTKLLNDEVILLRPGDEMTITEANREICGQGMICRALEGHPKSILTKLFAEALHPFHAKVFLQTDKPIQVIFGKDSSSYTLKSSAALAISRDLAYLAVTKHFVNESIKNRVPVRFPELNGRRLIHFTDFDAKEFVSAEGYNELKKPENILRALNQSLPPTHSFSLHFKGGLFAYPINYKDPLKGLVVGATEYLTLTLAPAASID